MENLVKIEKIIHNGYGLAKINNKVTFVANVLENETVSIKIIDQKKQYDFAIPIKIIEPSPFRINPICPFYPECGGCQFMHTDYPNQLAIKTNILNTFLEKTKPDKVEEFIKSTESINYKTAVTFIINSSNTGFYQRHTKNFVKIDYCYQVDDIMNQFIKQAKIPVSFEKLKIKIDNNAKISSNLYSSNKKDNHLSYLIDDLHLEYDYRVFFQNNKYILPLWLKKIYDEAKDYSLKRVLDIFSGVGTISLYLAKNLPVKKITGIEIENTATNFAKSNREKNKIYNANFIAGNAEKILKNYENATLIILNPPRTGAGEKIIYQITKLNPEAIIYSSCEISQFTQDADYLIKNGYKCKKIIPLDMFPQTFHFEIIGVFER